MHLGRLSKGLDQISLTLFQGPALASRSLRAQPNVSLMHLDISLMHFGAFETRLQRCQAMACLCMLLPNLGIVPCALPAVCVVCVCVCVCVCERERERERERVSE